MAIFQGLIFLVFGFGLLLIAYQSLARGWLPCGPKGLANRLEIRRTSQPFFFWTLLALYTLAGVSLTVFAIRLLAGQSAPLPLQ